MFITIKKKDFRIKSFTIISIIMGNSITIKIDYSINLATINNLVMLSQNLITYLK